MEEQASILFVDDEISILNALKRGMLDTDYDCHYVTSAKEALQVLEKEQISVIVSDMRMPEMDGLELLKIVKERWPKVVRIILSGYAQITQVIATINHADIFRFMLKPWNMSEEFLDVINSAVAYNRLQEEKEELEKSLIKKNEIYQNIFNTMNEANHFQRLVGQLRKWIMDQTEEILLANVRQDVSKEKLTLYVEDSYRFLRVLDSVDTKQNRKTICSEWMKSCEKTFKGIGEWQEFGVVNTAVEAAKDMLKTPQLFCEFINCTIFSLKSYLHATSLFAEAEVRELETKWFVLKTDIGYQGDLEKEELMDYVAFLAMLLSGILQFLDGEVEYIVEENGVQIKFFLPFAE